MTLVMVCPQCRGSYDNSQLCPRCGVGLLYSTGSRHLERDGGHSGLPERWHQSPGGRLLIGLVLSLGLCFGLLQLGMAGLRALGVDAASGALDPILGLILFHSLQALALLVGGALAGVGQPRAFLLGALVGLCSGLVFLGAMHGGWVSALVQSFSTDLLTPGTPVHHSTMYGLPIFQAFFGAMGGLLGGLVFKPIPDIALLDPNPPIKITGKKKVSKWPLLRWKGPISWGHAIVGTLVATVGAMNTDTILEFILTASDHKLKVVTDLEDRIAYGEIFSLTILIGGCIAGASTLNGLKQGTCVGVMLAVVLTGLLARTAHSPAALLFPVFSVLLLAPVGGWFGSELLPPTVRQPGWMKKRTGF